MQASTIIAASCCVLSCVSDSFPEGLPCDGTEQKCPPGQTCYLDGEATLCYSSRPPDRDAAPPDAFVGPCDPIAQDCPLGACYWEPEGAICDAEGSGSFRDPCIDNADCRAGLGCFAASSVDLECVPYCDTGDGTPCTGLDVCMALAAPVGACVFGGCDPITQNCTPTEGCYVDETMDNDTLCAPQGNFVHGEPCTTNQDCARGHHCLKCGPISECASYCDMNAGDVECMVHADGSTCQVIEGDVGACGSCS